MEGAALQYQQCRSLERSQVRIHCLTATCREKKKNRVLGRRLWLGRLHAACPPRQATRRRRRQSSLRDRLSLSKVKRKSKSTKA